MHNRPMRLLDTGLRAWCTAGTLLFSLVVVSQDAPTPANDVGTMAKKLQNPVSDVISVPLQSNFNFGFGPDEKTQTVVNFQPVVPVKLSDKLLLINRPILPIVSNPTPYDQSGIGDLNYTGWLSPLTASKVTWGVGPVLSIPIASPEELGTGQFALGPSAVVVVTQGKFVFGGLAGNMYSMSDDEDKTDVNFFSSQVFVNYNLKKGRSLTFAPLLTANWEAPSGEQWTVPLGGGVGQVFPMKGWFLNTGVQYYANVVHPSNGPTGSLRVVIAAAIPK